MWTAAADPSVLRARLMNPAGFGGPEIDLSRWAPCVVPGETRAHVRLHLPDGVLRLDVVEGAIAAEPVAFEPAIDLARPLEPQVASLRRLWALMRGELVAAPDQRFVRLVEALRVGDALAAGASQSAIGLGVFGGDWPGDGEHVKSKVRRRIALVAELRELGPRGVLAWRI